MKPSTSKFVCALVLYAPYMCGCNGKHLHSLRRGNISCETMRRRGWMNDWIDGKIFERDGGMNGNMSCVNL